MKKALLIGLGIALLLISTLFIFLRLAFGPRHDSITIDLKIEGKLICEETYNADFADEFYDVNMVLETASGKRYNVGSVTFHDEDWSKTIIARRTGDWLVIPLEPDNFVQIKMINTVSGQLNDTTLIPFDLRKDLLYKQRFKDRPSHLYPGTSKITNISTDMIVVSYEYKAKAEHPSEVLVSQRAVYEISRAEGTLQTKEMHERVVQ